jgi:hypothetical protein
MKNYWSLIGSLTLSIWALICLSIFMYFPGAISQIQGATLYESSTLFEKITRISATEYLLDALSATTGIAFYAVSCISLGMVVFSIFKLEKTNTTGRLSWKDALIPTYFLLGNAAFSVIFLSLAMASNLTKIYSILILLLGFLSGFGKFKKLHIPKMGFSNGFEKALGISSLIMLTVAIFHSSARLSYDAASMYLSVAKLTALENHVGFYMENSFPVSVLHSVSQSAAILQIFGDQTARMGTWVFGVATIAIALALAKNERLSVSARHIVPILILTSTAFLDQMGDGKVDLLGTAYSLAAVFWLTTATKAGETGLYKNLYVLSGLFIGFASILRPQNSYLLSLFILAYLAQGVKLKRQFIAHTARQLLWVASGAAGFAIFHFLVNKIVLNDPFAFMNSLTAINPTNGPWDYKPENEWINKLLYPLVVTFKNSGASLGNITPLVVMFLPSLAFRNIRVEAGMHKQALQLVTSAGLTMIAWILTIFSVVEVRYAMFLWILLFFPIAEIIACAIKIGTATVKGLAVCSIFVLISFIIIRSLYISLSTYSPIDSWKNPNCFDRDNCLIIKTINDAADEGARVLTLSGMRYYLRNDLFACSTNRDEFTIFQRMNPGDEEIFWLEVYRRNFKFIAFEKEYVTGSAQLKIIPGPDSAPDWITLEPIFGKSGDRKIAYRIHVNKPPLDIEWTCRQNSSTKKWEVLQESP